MSLGWELELLILPHPIASQLGASPGSGTPVNGNRREVALSRVWLKEGRRIGAISAVNVPQALGWVLHVSHLT